MQPIAGAFRPRVVVRAQVRRRRAVTAAAMITAVTVTVMAGFHADPRSSASPAVTKHVALSHHARTPSPAVAQQPAASHRVPLKSPCVHNRQAQLVVVSIRRQHEWACAHHRTALSTPVTTGATGRPGNATPHGDFAVQGLDRDTVLTTTAAGHYRVKYWIPFHLGVWGFHDASWQTIPFGSQKYVKQGSHGCVHVPLAAMRWLFHWVRYGTSVRIT
jgi:lipoprotein-anchoring transpeptidase ErfK/SrfK